MKKWLIGSLIAVASLTLVATEVHAKRMGGGSSVGRQSSSFKSNTTNKSATTPSNPSTPSAAPAAKPNAAPAQTSRFGGMGGILGGVLGGLALGALFSSLGFGGMSALLGQIATFALFGFLALMLFRFFTRKKTASPAYQNSHHATPFNTNQGLNAGAPLQRSAFDAPKPDAPSFNGGAFDASAPAFASAAQTTLPAGVNETDFLRQTKASFIRMQAAWDKADALDIHGFTTPELYAELRLQLQERGAAPNVTDVQSLNAEILASEETTQASFISVKLSGRIKESPDQAAEDFVEIWHMTKTASDSDWRLAGIEQPV